MRLPTRAAARFCAQNHRDDNHHSKDCMNRCLKSNNHSFLTAQTHTRARIVEERTTANAPKGPKAVLQLGQHIFGRQLAPSKGHSLTTLAFIAVVVERLHGVQAALESADFRRAAGDAIGNATVLHIRPRNNERSAPCSYANATATSSNKTKIHKTKSIQWFRSAAQNRKKAN